MQVSRRPHAVTLAVVAALTLAACTASGEGTPSGGRSPDEAARQGPVWDTRPDSVAAVGDSITRAFDACTVLSDCPEVSWATGTDAGVASLASQLLDGDEAALTTRTWNLAETGARAADLPAQVREAVAHDPALVTVLIGANDACAADLDGMTPTADFRADLERSMEIVREELPDTQVYMSSVPDLLRLWSEGNGSTMARAVWRLADICPSMLAADGEDEVAATERRDEVRDRVREYNTVLEEVCAADDLCRYDGGAVFDYPFTPDHLSDWDWFHPSREGQSELAALAYAQVTAE
ncbi:SGNH/GDSL hydrolase family protein [Streptomyces avicenniae]|uniref:SGNH/GDSL hydrolase family protein n=1 Tax=Streptomyces avicenniae TaxID=500153 RepID=UPI00069B169B|nr:SGNH/GDSL hydrolase family protein [Streptomyces avicenniae]